MLVPEATEAGRRARRSSERARRATTLWRTVMRSTPSLLHVTNGESAGNTLRQTALGGAVLPWQDALHEGPVPALPRQELLRARARFLAECGWGSRQAVLSSLERRDQQLLEALRDDLQVVLWFEHDLYDQLQLLDVLALAHSEGAAPELIVVGSFPGRPSFAGLGELTASELETLWPSRGRATPAALAAATSAWAALRAPEPTALAEWATRDTPALPFLAPALRRLLEELPAPGDGLSGTERRALEAVAAGAHSPPAAFVAAQRLEEAPVPRRLVVLPSALGARAGNDEAPRVRRRHAASPAASAQRQPAVRPPPAAADRNRRAHAQRRGRPGRAPRRRPLGRRHPHHARQHLALGRHRAEARSTALGSRSSWTPRERLDDRLRRARRGRAPAPRRSPRCRAPGRPRSSPGRSRPRGRGRAGGRRTPRRSCARSMRR